MFNLNSPTIQAMLSDIPQGVGNLPVYYGNTPTVETITPQQPMYAPQDINIPQPQAQPMYQQQPMYGYQPQQPVYNQQMPYPSPKEMLMNSQLAGNYYQPTTFAQPRNIVGGYNPGFQQAFAGYSNPYMGYGYSGFGCAGYSMYPKEVNPRDQNSLDTYRMAMENGFTYEEQIENDVSVYKACSRLVSKSLNRSYDEMQRCLSTFDPYDPTKKPEHPEDKARYERRLKEHVVVQIVKTEVIDKGENGDEEKIKETVLGTYDSISTRGFNYVQNMYAFFQAQNKMIEFEIAKINRHNWLFDHAIEREYDKCDIVDFFNTGACHIASDELMRRQSKMESDIKQLYNRDKLIADIRNGGKKSRANAKALERLNIDNEGFIQGGHGILPNGMRVSPGVDPEVASSFKYNPATGEFRIEAPGFIKNRLDAARANFLSSINNGKTQPSMMNNGGGGN